MSLILLGFLSLFERHVACRLHVGMFSKSQDQIQLSWNNNVLFIEYNIIQRRDCMGS